MTCQDLADLLAKTPTLRVEALGRNVIGVERSLRLRHPHDRDLDLVMTWDDLEPPERVYTCGDIAAQLRRSPDRTIRVFTELRWHDVAGVEASGGVARVVLAA